MSNILTGLTELSNDTLASYKKKAGADATVADKEGDTKKANKRFSGIVKATKKQFANDSKSIKENNNFDKLGFSVRSDILWPAKLFETKNTQAVEDLRNWLDTQRNKTEKPKEKSNCILAMIQHTFDEIVVMYGDAKYIGETETHYILQVPSGEHEYSKKNQIVFNSQKAFDHFITMLHLRYADANITVKKDTVTETTNNYHANRTGFRRGQRDDERHDLDTTKQQVWGLKINGKVWSKGGVDVTFNSKEAALNIRNSILKNKPDLEIGLITRGGVAEDELDENCWKGYHKEGNKKMFGKTVPNCVKNEGVAEGSEHYDGIEISMEKEDDEIMVKAMMSGGRELGHVLFVIDGEYLAPQDLEVDERYQGQGIAATMYDYVKSKGYKIRRSGQQTDAGAGFWDKHKPGKNVWEQGVAEDQHSCPHCGGEIVSEELMNEKKDACYYKVKSRYKVWPSAYASGALVKCRKKGASNWGTGGKKNESSILEGIEQADESLHDWFNKEKWVRMDTKGNIKGPCAREPGEGKPKCLPQSKAHSLGKKGRASAAQRKRREDPNPERSGKAINVNTKKKSNEDVLDEKWSQKYKKSINCSNPKGFSQKAHCAGKKK